MINSAALLMMKYQNPTGRIAPDRVTMIKRLETESKERQRVGVKRLKRGLDSSECDI